MRWICVEDCRAVGQNFRKGDIAEHPSNPFPEYFVAYAGDKTSHTEAILTRDLDGTVRFKKGHWEDMRFPATRTRQGALNKPDFDYTNVGLLFPADEDEKIYITEQIPHDWRQGTTIHPHIHWIQSQDEEVEWVLQYRFYDNGDVPGAFTTVSVKSESAFSYTQDAVQISMFPDIELPELGTSALFDFIIYRSTGDSYTGDVLFKTFDFHYLRDSLGSGREYSK